MKKATKKLRKSRSKVDSGGLPQCRCGCGEMVSGPSRMYRQGHDARFAGRVAKLQDGRLTMAALAKQIKSYAIPLYQAAAKAR